MNTPRVFTGIPHRMTQQDAYRLIQRHSKRAGIETRIGNHTMRDTGITQLCDLRGDASSLDEYHLVGI